MSNNKRYFRGIFFALLALLACAGTDLVAGHLHAVIVGDTGAQDLKSSIVVDMQNIDTHVREIARYTQLEPKVTHISAQEASSQAVLDCLRNLQSSEDDVIFFYFSGHGYRTPSKAGNPWPNIYFVSDQTGIDFLEIGSILKNKAAHLSVAIADCCNSSLPDYVAPPIAKGKHKPRPNEEKVRRNMQKLFLETNGVVLIAGAKEGQPSWAMSQSGSLCTSAYSDTFKTFAKQVSSDIVDWQLVLDQVAYKTHLLAVANGIAQEPIYLIEN